MSFGATHGPERSVAHSRVLLLVDDASAFGRVVDYVVSACLLFGADLTLLTVVSEPPDADSLELERRRLGAARCLSSARTLLESMNIDVRCRVIDGDAEEQALATAEDEGAGLVVLPVGDGDHGRAERIAHRLIDGGRASALVVPADDESRPRLFLPRPSRSNGPRRPMMRFTHLRLFCVVTILLAACGGTSHPATPGSTWSDSPSTDGAGCQDDRAGHSTADATPLALGERRGCAGPDPDVYEVRAARHAAGMLFELAVSTDADAVDVAILDREGTELAATAIAGGTPGSLYGVIASETVVFVSVGSQTAQAPYALSLSTTPLDDDSEPNGTTESAQPLNLDLARAALLQTAANDPSLGVDVYQVLVSRSGRLEVSVEPQTDGISVDIELLSADGEQLERSAAANRGGSVQIETRVRRGTYFVRVVEADDSSRRAAGVGEPPRFLSVPYLIVARSG